MRVSMVLAMYFFLKLTLRNDAKLAELLARLVNINISYLAD